VLSRIAQFFRPAPPPPAPKRIDFDPSTIDAEGFFAELRALRREVDQKLGDDDTAHVRKMERIARTAIAVGLATAWMGPNPVSAIALSLGRNTQWLLMHHVGHRGYDRVPGIPKRFTSRVFARGKRRMIDWADWMIPEAWMYEHNVLHHANTGEQKDPDLIERNAEPIRNARVPLIVKYAWLGLFAANWRSYYYAPNTVRAWVESAPRKEGAPALDYTKTLWLRSYLPYGALQFVGLPLLFAPLGPLAVGSALVNSLAAEVLANFHTFLVVGPNHTGDDLVRFDERPASSAEAMVRQVVSSVNYATGTEAIDYAHLYLNYQIEHHIWPDLPMHRYRELQPKVKALCAKYGIPYIQESVFRRARKMIDVTVGQATMMRATRLEPFAEAVAVAAE